MVFSKIRKLRRLHAHGFDRAIAQTDADDHSAGSIFFQSRVSAADHGRMTRQRIGNAGAEFYSRGVESHRGHVDIGLAPDEMRIADPDMAIAKLFRHFRQMNHLL